MEIYEPNPHKTHSYSWLSFLFTLAVFAAAIYYRIPAMLNAGGLNSDTAVVGLQGRHFLQGEWSLYLWGAGYQSAWESFLAAFFFSFMGATPLALQMVPVSGFLVMLLFAFIVLNRRVGPLSAFFLSLILALCSVVVFSITIAAPRQWCLTALFGAIALFDGAPASRYRVRMFFWGGVLTILSACLDFYALQLIPAVLLLGLFCSLDDSRDALARRRGVLMLGVGLLLGVFVMALLRVFGTPAGASTSFSIARFPENAKLLWETCLPYLLGAKVFFREEGLAPQLWKGPEWFGWLQLWGGWSLFGSLLISGVLALSSKTPKEVRRLGVMGGFAVACSLLGFCGSKMVSDLFSARYLTAILWMAPFALLPLMYRFQKAFTLLSLIPFLVVSTASVWINYGNAVDGPRGVALSSGRAETEMELAKALRQHRISTAVAQYWLAYRLCFLFEENPVVTPTDPGSSRYPPFQDRLIKAPIVAHIFHPTSPSESPDEEQLRLIERDIPHQRLEIGDYTVLIKYLKGAPLGD